METNNTDEEKYKTGFNQGYLMAEHLPELSDSLAKTKFKSPWMEGFLEGRLQLVMDQVNKSKNIEPVQTKEKNIQPDKPKANRDIDR